MGGAENLAVFVAACGWDVSALRPLAKEQDEGLWQCDRCAWNAMAYWCQECDDWVCRESCWSDEQEVCLRCARPGNRDTDTGVLPAASVGGGCGWGVGGGSPGGETAPAQGAPTGERGVGGTLTWDGPDSAEVCPS